MPRLGIQMLRSLLINLAAFSLIIGAVLYPRHLMLSIEGYKVAVDYTVGTSAIEALAANVKQFFTDLFVNKSLGFSRFNGETAGEAVIRAVGNSLAVICGALVIGFVFGVLKGILDYRLSKTRLNILGNWTTWMFQSVPDFFFLLLVQWFIVKHVTAIRFFADEGWQGFILPTLLVSLYPIVYIASITSASLADQEGKLYLLFAKAKGLSNRMILIKHMLRRSMGTVIIQLPTLLVYILANLLMVEIYRGFPGAAWRLYLALDYNTYFGTGYEYEPGIIIGISFCFMLLILLVQWISQIARKYYDPMMR
ncbi:ABC transporter permease subunit [Paenibacillus dakarensis]|uniref:ABC transporter permease subunit n=1 Tax=Paenibacillus dakarensis TaxID=1527293 RepID=UPI0006D549C9|nr:ABC transporter permease subunit [Paenibacillus dakarensis]